MIGQLGQGGNPRRIGVRSPAPPRARRTPEANGSGIICATTIPQPQSPAVQLPTRHPDSRRRAALRQPNPGSKGDPARSLSGPLNSIRSPVSPSHSGSICAFTARLGLLGGHYRSISMTSGGAWRYVVESWYVNCPYRTAAVLPHTSALASKHYLISLISRALP